VPRHRAVYRPLSESPLWTAQRRFYERAGIEAWRAGTVPHHVTSNVALATAYARVVLGLLIDMGGSGRPPCPPAGRARRSHDRPQCAGKSGKLDPLYILELGAGPGRFAFLFLRALEMLSHGDVPVRYVMTDVAEATIEFWRNHQAFAPFLRAGRLDFARFDAQSDGTLRLEREQRTIAPSAPAGRLVVIANYVFSGLPHDAFAVRAGRMHDYLAAVRLPRRARGAADAVLAWRVGARATTPYVEDDFNAILRDYAPTSAAGRVLFPIAALRCLDRLVALAREDLLVLAADRGTTGAADAVTRAADLAVARHGAVSFPLNFHALRAWVTRRGGWSLRPSHGHRHVHVAAFLLDAQGGTWPATHSAYEQAIASGGPDKLYALRRGLSAVAGQLRPPELLTLMRLCGPDPRVIAECIRPLWPFLADADAPLRREIREAVLAAWPNYYHLGEAYDLPFHLALLLYEVRAYAEAQALFEESVRLYGEDAATRWNLGLCHVALGKPVEALASFRRGQTLAPDLHPAGLALVKAGVPAHSGRSRLRRVRPVGGLGGRPEPPMS
jgi:tetratricopeptide (TPR) repeat protein